MKASDVMTSSVLCVSLNATVGEVARTMIRERISGLPVVNDDNILVGIVTEGDLLRRVEAGTERARPHWLEFILGGAKLATEYVASHSQKVADVMTRNVTAVTEDTALADIVSLMERNKIKRVPVVYEGRVVGIVSRANLLKALADASAPETAKDDDAIRKALETELGKRPWYARQGHAVVHDGVVDLWGVVLHDSERTAIRVAAENIPGVKAVRDHMAWIEPLTGTVVEAGEDAR